MISLLISVLRHSTTFGMPDTQEKGRPIASQPPCSCFLTRRQIFKISDTGSHRNVTTELRRGRDNHSACTHGQATTCWNILCVRQLGEARPTEAAPVKDRFVFFFFDQNTIQKVESINPIDGKHGCETYCAGHRCRLRDIVVLGLDTLRAFADSARFDVVASSIGVRLGGWRELVGTWC